MPASTRPRKYSASGTMSAMRSRNGGRWIGTYTDNTMHNLQVERFYRPEMINGMLASADGPIKTFPLRGIKDSPPYLHDGRLLTLDDTVEFFNLVLGTKLTPPEKQDLLQFLRAL